jgi:hypothetical protein
MIMGMYPYRHENTINHLFPAGSERRNGSRFPLAEEVRFRPLDGSGMLQPDGTGTTVDMGRGGVLFTSAAPPTAGRLVEISVNWPVPLNGTCPLKFVAVGHVVRSTGTLAAVKIERYQFKTRGRAVRQG